MANKHVKMLFTNKGVWIRVMLILLFSYQIGKDLISDNTQ